MRFENWRRRARALLAQARSHPAGRHALGVLAWLAEPAAAIGIVFLATSAIAEPFYVPSGSMEPALAIGDAIIAAKYPYGYSHYSVRWGLSPDLPGKLFAAVPARGDVVVFYPVNHPAEVWVKRVIGLPGDRVQMIQGRLFINGTGLGLTPAGHGAVEDGSGTYRQAGRYVETLPGGRTHPVYKWHWDGPLDNTQAITVPAGNIFVMGDNRDDSWDSRVPRTAGGIGTVPLDHVIGRAQLVIASYDFLNAGRDRYLGALRLSRLFDAIR